MKLKTTEHGWFNYIKEKVETYTSIDISKIGWTELLWIFGILVGGFITGILFKKHGRSILLFIATSFFLLWGLSYLGVATIHLEKAKLLIGLPSNATVQTAYSMCVQYIKAHALIAGTGIFGILMGYIFGA